MSGTTLAATDATAGREAGRETGRAAFLAAAGWAGAEAVALAGDASPRRYWRLRRSDGRTAILSEAEPGVARAFAAVGLWLRARGFSAPDLLQAEPERGLLLLEDLGDALFATVAAREPALEPALYEAAADLLLALQAEPPPETVALGGVVHAPAPYDRATLLREARLALEWWAPAAGAPPPPDALAEFEELVGQATAHAAEDRRALVLLDYHAENLLWLPERRGLARIGLLDHQDARRGAPEYDFVSLLEDARRDVGAGAARAARARYAAGRGLTAEALAAAAAPLAAQRNLKILGIFARLAARDGKPRYLALLPRVWAHLQADLAHPALARLRAFVAARLPAPTPEALARAAAATLRGEAR